MQACAQPLQVNTYMLAIRPRSRTAHVIAELDRLGIKLDRRWMVTKHDGTFLTGREHPNLVVLQPAFEVSGSASAKRCGVRLPDPTTIVQTTS